MLRNNLIILCFLILPGAFAQHNKTQIKNMAEPEIGTGLLIDKADRNNNFYDNEDTYSLPLASLTIEGEIENPGPVDFSKFQKRTVIVKETLLNKEGSNTFSGAYRYDGYSLFDLLTDRILKKKNAAAFRPIIDLYVEIENASGEKVVLSWGEIFYPNFLHNCIIATEVMRIVPSKSKDLWPLPTQSKLVIAQDLITERNISSPEKITVKSYEREIPVNRERSPLYSPTIKIISPDKVQEIPAGTPENLQPQTLHTVFYGRGRGIHSTQPFTGVNLKDLLPEKFRMSKPNLQNGLVVIAGLDGYRAVYSLSEIINRNDQAAILLVPCPEEKDGGKYRIFPSCDFFSDRAVKAVSEIYLEIIN